MSLLTIPRELRDKIIRLVVTSSRPAPQDASNLGNREERAGFHDHSTFWAKDVLYESTFSRLDLIPLLIVNHQLHDETISSISRLTQSSYVVDLMLVNERQVWPTWLVLPELSTHIDKIHATLRIVGSGPSGRRARTGFSRGDAGPVSIVWCFYHLWDRLLKFGPVGYSRARRCVNLLELDVVSPESHLSVAPLDMNPHDLPYERKKSGVDYILNPISVLKTIEFGFGILMRMDDHSARYGGVIYEGLGRFRLLHDGELYREWDISELFKNLEFDNSFNMTARADRQTKFNEWKAKTTKTRIQVGLLQANPDLRPKTRSRSLTEPFIQGAPTEMPHMVADRIEESM